MPAWPLFTAFSVRTDVDTSANFTEKNKRKKIEGTQHLNRVPPAADIGPGID